MNSIFKLAFDVWRLVFPNFAGQTGSRSEARFTGFFLPLALMMAGGLFVPAPASAALWGKKQKREVADQLIQIDTNKNPMAAFWRDPEFIKRFTGAYGFHGAIEPKLKSTEDVQFQNDVLLDLLQTDPARARQALVGYIKPDSNEYFDFILAKLYYQNDDLTNAVRHYEAAVAKLPSYRAAHQELGFIFVREQKFQEAIKHLTRTIELGGANNHTYGLLGYSYLNQEAFISAEAAYKNAMLLDPDNKDWKLGIVQCLVATENFRPALRMIDELLAAHPDQSSLWALQAGVFLQTDQADKAAVNLEMLRKFGEADVKNLMLLGDIYMMQDAKEMALPVYLEGIGKEGAGDLSRSLRAAEILTARGAWDEARQLFAKIREVGGATLGGEHEMNLLKLESKVAMATGSGDEAIEVLEEIIVKNPLDGEALLLAGDYYAANGEREKAENRYALAAKISGYEAEAWVKLAQALVKAQKYTDAVEFLRKAQRMRPRDNIQRYLEKVEEAAARSGRS